MGLGSAWQGSPQLCVQLCGARLGCAVLAPVVLASARLGVRLCWDGSDRLCLPRFCWPRLGWARFVLGLDGLGCGGFCGGVSCVS